MRDFWKVGVLLVFIFGLGACAKQTEEISECAALTQGGQHVEEEANKQGISKALTEKVISLKQGKVMEGIKKRGADSIYYCNEENIKDLEDYGLGLPILVCKDPVYDITYYVNYGRDYFIYAFQDGISELVLEIPARELYCINGELFFLVDSYELYKLEDITEGNVLKYNPTNGEVNVVLTVQAEDMVVYPDGICYEILDKVVTLENGSIMPYVSRFYYSFSEKESNKFGSQLVKMNRWKKGHFVVELEVNEETGLGMPSGIHLENVKNEVVGSCDGLDTFPEGCRIVGDYLYYIDATEASLRKYSLKTGEEATVIEFAILTGGWNDFVIKDDIVYVDNLLRVSLKDGKQYDVEVSGKVGTEGYFDALYTDGEHLFCVNDGTLWYLTEERVNESGIQKEMLAGRYVEYNCYEYCLHSLGLVTD